VNKLIGQKSCRCCGQGGLIFELALALEEYLALLPDGTELLITSGYRCPAHNAEVGGAKHSQHLLGRAVDLWSDQVGVRDLARAAEAIPAFAVGGIGVYVGRREWIHLDVRGHRARWGQRDGRAVSFEEAMTCD